MKKIDILVENIVAHKEFIAPSITDAIISKTHYNANNTIFPETIGRGNFLFESSKEYFTQILNKMKRYHNIDDITPKDFFNIKRNINNLLKDMISIEQNFEKELNNLAVEIIKDYFSVPPEISFEFKNNSKDIFDSIEEENIFTASNNNIFDDNYDDIYGLSSINNQIDRKRFNYNLICGGANKSMSLYKNYTDSIDKFNYKLCNYYDKFNSFNDFNLWVTPDEVLTQEIDSVGGFKILTNDTGYKIVIDAPFFLSKLYEMSKAILSILFQEKYNNSYVDYENPWNNRIGSIVWSKFLGCANQKKNFPYIIDAINDLSDDDYKYVMQEVLMNTKHSKNMFKDLYLSFQ